MDATLVKLSLLYYFDSFFRAAVVTLMPALSALILFRLSASLFSNRDRSVMRCVLSGYTLAFVVAPVYVGYPFYDLLLSVGAFGLAAVLLWSERSSEQLPPAASDRATSSRR